MATIDLRGVTFRYQLTGNPDGELLVFSTSLGAHLEMWDPQVEHLAGTCRILRYDMRGHGQSSTPTGPYTLQQLGEDLLALLDALQLDAINYCGLSIGGVIGQWLALHAPRRLRKLILANTAAKIGTSAAWDDRIAAIQREGMAPLASASLERWFTPEFRATNAPIIARMQQMLLAGDPAGYIATCAVLRDADLRDQIAGIRTHTLILAGRHDPVTTVSDAEFLQSRIPDAQLQVLPAAHIANAEAAPLFNQAILQFLGMNEEPSS